MAKPSGRVDEELKEKIRSSVRIEDVISKYTKLEKSGSNYKALCPFHSEDTPSFYVYAKEQRYYCFGCHKSGDVFNFLMEKKQISFPDALREAARLGGIDLPEASTKPAERISPERQQLFRLMEDAASFGEYELGNWKYHEVLDYLHARGIPDEQIAQFRLGYFPSAREQSLVGFLQKKGYSSRQIVDTGMAYESRQGLSDVFASRMDIPVRDQDGHTVAFTARTMLQGDAERKYINNGQTQIYQKGEVLFNLDRAGAAIKRRRKAVIAEGPMDVMAIERAGILNAVASLGTSMTAAQMRLLRPYADTLVFSYDGDAPGQKSAFQRGEEALAMGFEVKVTRNDTGLDPDEIDRRKGLGPQKNREILENPVDYLDFALAYLQKEYGNLQDYDAKNAFARKMAFLIARYGKGAKQEYFLHQTAAVSGLSDEYVQGLMPRAGRAAEEIAVPVRQPSALKRRSEERILRLQDEVLKQLLLSREAVQEYQASHYFQLEDGHESCKNLILAYYQDHDTLFREEFAAWLRRQGHEGEKALDMLKEIAENENLSQKYDPRVLKDSLKKINIEALRKRNSELKSSLKHMEDPVEKDRVLRQIAQYADLIHQLERMAE